MPAQIPNATDRTEGSDSVMTRSPPGSTVRVTASSPPADGCVLTSRGASARGDGFGDLRGHPQSPARRDGRHRRPVPLALDHFHGNQGQLAAVVHLADLYLDLVTHLDHIVDVLDPGPAVQLPDLGDRKS